MGVFAAGASPIGSPKLVPAHSALRRRGSAWARTAEWRRTLSGLIPAARSNRWGPMVHIPDVVDTDEYRAGVAPRVLIVEQVGARTALWVALRKDDTLLGVFTIYQREVRPFKPHPLRWG